MEWRRQPNRLVLGIGNPLRGDDGVGPLLAEQTAVLIAADPACQVAVRSVHQLTPELAEELAHLDAVLFIDAWLAPLGAVPQLQPLSSLAAAPGASAGSHRLEPASLLALSQTLYGQAPKAQLLVVPAHAFDHGAELSPQLQAALPQARALLRQWLFGHA